MARVVKDADERRAEILDTAYALFMRSGYEATSVQEIINSIGIAKGTFYHHFRSKAALLEALLHRVTEQILGFAEPLVATSELPALDKLNALFHSVGSWKAAHRDFLVPALKAIRLPENVPLRQGLERQSLEVFTPLVGGIIAEGMEEGVFDVFDPLLAARLIFHLQLEVGNALGDLVLDHHLPDSLERARRLVVAHDQAVARILGAPEGSFHLVESEALEAWFE